MAAVFRKQRLAEIVHFRANSFYADADLLVRIHSSCDCMCNTLQVMLVRQFLFL